MIACFAVIGISLGIKMKFAEAQALRSTRLDAKLIDAKSRVIDNSLIESTYHATVRAYGGDIYLPAYTEDIVFRPSFTSNLETSNAIIPGSAILRISGELPAMNGRYILKEYEEADITIIVTMRVIPSAITSDRLVFKTELTSLIWKPVIQQYNEDEVGNPLLDVTQLKWETNPVIVWKKIPKLTFSSFGNYQSNLGVGEEVKGQQLVGPANVSGIFSKLRNIFSKD